MKASTSPQAQTDAQCTRCFLEDVARSLDGLPELGDGVVARTCAEVQKRYWRAPDLTLAAGSAAEVERICASSGEDQ